MTIRWMMAFAILCSWAGPGYSQELIAPAASTKEERAKDLRWCAEVVAQGKMGGYAVLSIIDDLKPVVLKDRNTGGFVYTTMLSNRSMPVVDAEGNPTRKEGLFGKPAPDKTSDRYVMCLLAMGYRWSDSAQSYFETVRELAAQGSAPAQAELAILYTSQKSRAVRFDNTAFATWTRKAAEQGYPPAQFNLALAYSDGVGVERNDDEALHWMVLAATNGYARATPVLQQQEQIRAKLQARRQDVAGWDADYRAAQGGDPKAQFVLAARYEDGRGVERSMSQALDWYRKAADSGFADAQAYLGIIYDKGRGLPQDDAEAAQWYRKAADQGSGPAQYNLGVFYYYGQGIPADKVEAKKWFERARGSGYTGAAAALKELY